MQIAVFGKRIETGSLEYVQQLFEKLCDEKVQIWIYEPFYNLIKDSINISPGFRLFSTHIELNNKIDLLLSVGGDGSLLDTITLIRDSGIPILGINTGRLGFISSVARKEIVPVIDAIINGEFITEERALIRLETEDNLFGETNYALNELTVHKKDSSSMIHINAYVDGRFLNAYWADGLIVATPTGSTGYSLSCGGPIITPGSENFLITPIATHNLTVRPIVIPDNSTVTLKIKGRDDSFLIGMDSRTSVIDESIELIVRKEEFKIKLIGFENSDFFSTIRKKLMWGLDLRDYSQSNTF